MKSNDAFTSNCRHCRFYSPEGRRGGHCSQLNVSVQSTWKACSLSSPIFEPEWEFASIPVWHSETAFVRQTNSEGQSFTYTIEPTETDSEVSVTSI